jgi:hypothetical protein
MSGADAAAPRHARRQKGVSPSQHPGTSVTRLAQPGTGVAEKSLSDVPPCFGQCQLTTGEWDERGTGCVSTSSHSAHSGSP